MYWADEMVPKRENGQAANRRLTRYIMLASLFHLLSYITQRTQCMSMPVQYAIKLMWGLFAHTSDNPLS